MGDSVDIVVQQTGAEDAAAAIGNIGEAAATSATQVDAANQSLAFLKDAADSAQSPLQQLAEASNSLSSSSSEAYRMVYNQQTGLYDIVTASQDAATALQGISTANDNVGTSSGGAAEKLAAQAQATTQVAQETEKHSEASHKATEATESLNEATKLLKDALTALGLIFSAEKILEVTEAYQKMEIQLKSVSTNVKDLEENSNALFAISQKTGSSFTANVAAFQKLATETSGLNLSQKDLIETIGNVDRVVQQSGGTSDQAAQAVSLFGRALATGTVQGRQMRTILLEYPQLGQLVAQGLNTSTQALVSNSAKTATSSKEFIDAFNKAAESSKQAGATINLTLNGAIQTLGNSIVRFIGQAEHGTGAVELLAKGIQLVATNFALVAGVVETAVILFGSYYTLLVIIPGAINLITASVSRLTLAIAANPLGFLAVALVAIIGLVYQFGNQVKITSDGSITLLGAVIGTWNFLKEKIGEVVTYLVVNWGPTFARIGAVASAAMSGVITVLQSVLFLLSYISPAAAVAYAAMTAGADGATTSTNSLTKSMVDATTELNHAHTEADGLGTALGSGGASVAGSAVAAKGAVSALNDVLTQNGRVVADNIPVFATFKNGIEQTAAAVLAAKSQVENAFGQMVTDTDEWARRSGDDFNKVAGAAKAMASAVSSADATVASASSSGGSSGGGSSGGATGSSGGGAVGYGGGGSQQNLPSDLQFLIGHGYKGYADSWAVMLQEASSIQNIGFRGSILSLLNGDAIAAAAAGDKSLTPALLERLHKAAYDPQGAPGYWNGGEFTVGGGGGTDSQLVQFYASPGEKVSIQTPVQSQFHGSPLSGKGVNVTMNIQTTDANSFRRSQNQILLSLQSKLNGARVGLS